MSTPSFVLPLIALVVACQCTRPQVQTLEERMMTVRDRAHPEDSPKSPEDLLLAIIPDCPPLVRGKIVRVLGEKIAIRPSSHSAAKVPLPITMHCYRGKSYKAEVRLLESYKGLLLGVVTEQVPGRTLGKGDRATNSF